MGCKSQDMAQFMMVMKGRGGDLDWGPYIERLVTSGTFRGGSALGRGVCLSKAAAPSDCSVTGFMRFEAESLEVVRELLAGNPVFEAGSP